MSSPSTTLATTSPPESRIAVSTESVSRCCMSSRTVSRSTTTSTVCFFVFVSFGGSAISQSSPSTRMRTNPCFAMSSNSFTYSPLRARTTGASTCMRVRSGSARIWSTTWSTVCWRISLPHSGQCGTPARAYISRR